MSEPEGYQRVINQCTAQRTLLQKTGVTPDQVVVFDAGAGQGDITVTYLRSWPNATYFLFEPVPANVKGLEQRFRKHPRVHIVPKALSDKDGKAAFYVGGHNAEMSSLLRRPSEEDCHRYYREPNTAFSEITVDTITLDTFAEEANVEQVHLIKADVQGAERQVLEGTRRLMKRGMPLVWYTEVSFVELYKGAALFGEMDRLFNECGYSLFDLYNLGRSMVDRQLRSGDAIFVSKEVRSKVLNQYPACWVRGNLKFAMGMETRGKSD